MSIPEKDWKALRKHLPDWQEAYIEKKLQEYQEIIQRGGSSAVRFWELDKRMKADKKLTGVVVTDMRRSTAVFTIASLAECGAISDEDLSVFTEETRERVRDILSL
ncbi:MAG: hypothetical protein K6A40_09985 [Solobacterium sp.]|nr:hypothetical protein [Solobacterium sp.]